MGDIWRASAIFSIKGFAKSIGDFLTWPKNVPSASESFVSFDRGEYVDYFEGGGSPDCRFGWGASRARRSAEEPRPFCLPIRQNLEGLGPLSNGGVRQVLRSVEAGRNDEVSHRFELFELGRARPVSQICRF